MRKIFILLTAILLASVVWAQDTTIVKVNDKDVVTVQEDSAGTRVRVMDKDIVTVVEDSVGTRVKVGNNGGVEVIANHAGDTVRIRIGNRTIKIIEGEDGTSIKTSKEPKEEKERKKHFQGHWGGIEMGANIFHTEDYSSYNDPGVEGFFEINTPKSLSVNLNFAEFAFSNKRNTVALVTGMGFSFMDYRFNPDMTIGKNDEGWLNKIPLSADRNVEKSKLTVSYLTVPMILEFATPLKMNSTRLTLGAGVIGGLNIGSHTKVKYADAKEKERGKFNINALKYDLTGRIGLGDFAIFANYGMTSLFNKKGPEIYPLTVGISLLSH